MLKLAIPSKGRLRQDTLDWFKKRGVKITLSGSDREYAGQIEGVENVELVLLSAGEIPKELSAGRVHLGVTGTDLIHEKLPLKEDEVFSIQEMGFGHADLILAVPKTWIDVSSLDDLDAVAAQFRRNHGFRLRIATKYHYLVRNFLKAKGVADYQLVDSQGATEGTVANETAEAIADITSSGATLEANHLKILGDGTILKSQAGVWASQTANWTPKARAGFQALAEQAGWGKL